MGVWSEEISNNTKVCICWILNSHSKVSYRPLMTNRLCKGIDEQKENYGDENNRLLPCPRLVYREEAFYCEIMYIISIKH